MESTRFSTHLGHDLKNQQTLHCPFFRCEFKTNHFKTFSSRRSRKYKSVKNIRTPVLAETHTSIEASVGYCPS